MKYNSTALKLDDIVPLRYTQPLARKERPKGISQDHMRAPRSARTHLQLVTPFDVIDTRKETSLEDQLAEELGIREVSVKGRMRYSLAYEKKTLLDDEGELHLVQGGNKFISEVQRAHIIEAYKTYKTKIRGGIDDQIDALRIARETLPRRTFIETAESKLQAHMRKEIEAGAYAHARDIALKTGLLDVYAKAMATHVAQFNQYLFSDDAEIQEGVSTYTTRALEGMDNTRNGEGIVLQPKDGKYAYHTKRTVLFGMNKGLQPKEVLRLLKEHADLSHIDALVREKPIEHMTKQELTTALDIAKRHGLDTALYITPIERQLRQYTDFERDFARLKQGEGTYFKAHRFVDHYQQLGVQFDRKNVLKELAPVKTFFRRMKGLFFGKQTAKDEKKTSLDVFESYDAGNIGAELERMNLRGARVFA